VKATLKTTPKMRPKIWSRMIQSGPYMIPRRPDAPLNTTQFSLPKNDIAEELPFMQPSTTVQVFVVNGKPTGVQLPASVELTVTETEPGVKGDTVSNVTKPATLETGAVVNVPLFVNVGDRLKVDPREGRYISRA